MTIDQLAASPLSWDVENQLAPAGVDLHRDRQRRGKRRHIPVCADDEPSGWHTVDAAAVHGRNGRISIRGFHRSFDDTE